MSDMSYRLRPSHTEVPQSSCDRGVLSGWTDTPIGSGSLFSLIKSLYADVNHDKILIYGLRAECVSMADKTVPRPVARALRQMGQDLRTWRVLQRLTAEQVADRAGVDRKTVLNLENGERATLENTLRVARALGLLDQLVASVDPYESDVGRLRADEALPTRVKHTRGSK